MDEVRLQKHRINKALEPIKIMLLNKRATMTHHAWHEFVAQTRQSILHSPEQYLESESLTTDLLSTLVETSFNEFLHDLEIRLPRYAVL